MEKKKVKQQRKDWSTFFPFACMTNDLMFSFFIKSIIVIKVSPALSNTQGRIDFTFYPTHPAVPFISVIAMS